VSRTTALNAFLAEVAGASAEAKKRRTDDRNTRPLAATIRAMTVRRLLLESKCDQPSDDPPRTAPHANDEVRSPKARPARYVRGIAYRRHAQVTGEVSAVMREVVFGLFEHR
jgi:hypothetical protein